MTDISYETRQWERQQRKFALSPAEQLERKGLATEFSGGWRAQSATAYLTNHRLVICRNSAWMFLLVGVLRYVLSSKRIVLQFQRADIVQVVRKKHGFRAKLEVQLRDGSAHTLAFGKLDEWQRSLTADVAAAA